MTLDTHEPSSGARLQGPVSEKKRVLRRGSRCGSRCVSPCGSIIDGWFAAVSVRVYGLGPSTPKQVDCLVETLRNSHFSKPPAIFAIGHSW